MTATVEKTVFTAPNGKTFRIRPGTENPVSVAEMTRRRYKWYAQHKHLLAGYSTEQFIAEKRRDVEAGPE